MNVILAALLFAASPARANEPKVTVTPDPRLELVHVVNLLARPETPPPDFLFDGAAREKVLAAFAGQKDHAAVRLTRSFGGKLSYGAQANAILRHSAPPALEKVEMITKETLDDFGSEAALDAWVAALRSFASEGAFASYYDSRRAEFDAAAKPFQDALAKLDPLPKLEAYAGLEFTEKYPIYITPGAASYGSPVGPCERAPEMVSFVGAASFSPAEPELPKNRFQAMVWHESAHYIADALVDVYEPRIDRLAGLWDGQCVGTWRQCVKEHVVRGLMVRLTAAQSGEAAATTLMKELDRDKRGRYAYLPLVAGLLKDYETHRKDYPSLAEFYPKILDGLETELKARPEAAKKTVTRDYSGWDLRTGNTGVFMTERQRERGLKLLDRLLAKTFDPELAWERALIRFQLGRKSEAAEDAERVLAARPGDVDAQVLVGLARLPRLSNDREADATAVLAALPAGKRKDLTPVQAKSLARYWQNKKEYAQALEILDAELVKAPADPELHNDRGLCLYLSGRAEPAVAELRRALELRPGDLPASLTLGAVYTALGRKAEALAVYDAALAAPGQDPELLKLARSSRAGLK